MLTYGRHGITVDSLCSQVRRGAQTGAGSARCSPLRPLRHTATNAAPLPRADPPRDQERAQVCLRVGDVHEALAAALRTVSPASRRGRRCVVAQKLQSHWHASASVTTPTSTSTPPCSATRHEDGHGAETGQGLREARAGASILVACANRSHVVTRHRPDLC